MGKAGCNAVGNHHRYTMKKLLLSLIAATTLVVPFTSCKKDVSEEELLKNQLAQTDSLLKHGGVIKYTVKLVSAANSSMLKDAMSLKDAEVTAYQNDSMYTARTDANGFATFPNMRIGTVAVHVKLTGHAEVDYIADITPAESLINLSQTQIMNTVRYASTMVPMFPIADPGCATITGKVTAELDLTNTTPEPAPGVKVTATVDVDDPDFVARYIAPTQGTTSSPSAGRILKYAFSDASVTATTAADGTYTLKVPASVNGLPVNLSVADYQANQKLYLENDPNTGAFAPAEYTVNAIYSSRIPSSEVPVVKPIYAIIDKPTGVLGVINKNATFNVQIDANGGISKVDVINKGNYDRKPDLIIIGGGSGAIVDPVFNTSTGEVESIKIIEAGKGYISNTTWAIATLQKELRTAIIETSINSNNGNNSISFNLIDKGQGYITTPKINFITIKNNVAPIYTVNLNLWTQQVSTIYFKTQGQINTTETNFDKTSSIAFEKNLTVSSLSKNYTVLFHLGKGTRI
jgi:hypothetical protein